MQTIIMWVTTVSILCPEYGTILYQNFKADYTGCAGCTDETATAYTGSGAFIYQSNYNFCNNQPTRLCTTSMVADGLIEYLGNLYAKNRYGID